MELQYFLEFIDVLDKFSGGKFELIIFFIMS